MNTVALVLLVLSCGSRPLPAEPGPILGLVPVPLSHPLSHFQQRAEPREQYRLVFNAVRDGLESGNVGLFSRFLAPQVQVDLRDGESGLFSAHQAFYLLESYLRTRRLANLRFSTIGESDVNPFATGGAGISYKGSREVVQVYVALSLAGDRWVISRINIY
jgi:hypothetical protein